MSQPCGIAPCKREGKWRVVVKLWPVPFDHPKTGERMEKGHPKMPSILVESFDPKDLEALANPNDPVAVELALRSGKLRKLCVCDLHMRRMPGHPAEFFMGVSREMLLRGFEAKDLLAPDWETAEWVFEAAGGAW